MKDWSYYCETETPYCPYSDRRAMLQRLWKEFSEKPMTEAEREHARTVALADARLRQAQQNEKHYAELNAKQAEFFRDLRADLGYGDFLTEEGCVYLEGEVRLQAWSPEDWHATAEQLVDFAKAIVEYRKTE